MDTCLMILYRHDVVPYTVLFDREDADMVFNNKWTLVQGYAYSYNGDLPFQGMHRSILKAGKNQIVHHINGKKLDNRRSNLQILSRSEHQELHFCERREAKKKNPPPKKKRLSEADIRSIRSERDTRTLSFLAEKYNVCLNTIRGIVDKRTYRNIT